MLGVYGWVIKKALFLEGNVKSVSDSTVSKSFVQSSIHLFSRVLILCVDNLLQYDIPRDTMESAILNLIMLWR